MPNFLDHPTLIQQVQVSHSLPICRIFASDRDFTVPLDTFHSLLDIYHILKHFLNIFYGK